MKKDYQQPMLDIFLLKTEDILTESPFGEQNAFDPWREDSY